MIKKIPVDQLKIGDYVIKMDRSWFSTPFVTNKLAITSTEQIAKIKDFRIKEVWIDTDREKGKVVAPPEIQEKKPDEYLSIHAGNIMVNTILPFNLYLKKDDTYSVCFRKNTTFGTMSKGYFEANGISTLYIHPSEKGLFAKYDKAIETEMKSASKTHDDGPSLQEKTKRHNDFINNFVPIEPSIFMPGTKAPFNIYQEKEDNPTIILETGERVPESEIFAGETNKDGPNLLIHINDQENYEAFLKELYSGNISVSTEDAMKIRIHVMKENAKLVTKAFLNKPKSGKTLNDAKDVAMNLVDNIRNNPTSFYGKFRINVHDSYTYVHSVNVCSLTIGLAISLGINKTELSELALGALVHDVGKTMIPSSILNKPERLTEKELELVKKHVIWGSRLLVDHNFVAHKVLPPLLQHHEKLDGTGYPNQLRGDQIHLFGRITAIADALDALTTERPYREAAKPFEAVKILMEQKDAYDNNVIEHLVKMLGKQENLII